ncbi:MAG: 4a-hydroxytetrahydrobiopterin dehydratase [Sandaracinaceae bacterium]|nr:4a-hydroxytetrahydrobiopterin dehydratase [Sandaracinaceae bacterium]
MIRPLEEPEIRAALRELEGWEWNGNELVRTVELGSHPAAIALLTRIAFAAEALMHHPEVRISYRRLELRLTTHDVGGRVTERDIALAREIQAILESTKKMP